MSHFCGVCDIFVSGRRPQCDILGDLLSGGFFGAKELTDVVAMNES